MHPKKNIIQVINSRRAREEVMHEVKDELQNWMQIAVQIQWL